MQKYFDILGITPTATESEIRKAFKEKAKILHPDRNKSPHAHEEFLELYAALNFAIRNLNNPIGKFSDEVREAFEVARKKREQEQATRFSQMRYKAWTQTKEYKELVNIGIIQQFVSTLFILFIVVSVFGIFGKTTELKYGIPVGLSIGFILSIIIIKKNMLGLSLNLPKLFKAISELFTKETGVYLLIFILNIIIFFKIGLNTLLPLFSLFSLYILSFIILQTTSVWIFKMKKIIVKKILLSSLFISILLCLNFFISSHPTSKTYQLSEFQDDTLLEFKDEALSNYAGVRFFSDIERFYFINSIKFTFKKGFLGVYVVSDTEFVKNHKKTN